MDQLQKVGIVSGIMASLYFSCNILRHTVGS